MVDRQERETEGRGLKEETRVDFLDNIAPPRIVVLVTNQHTIRGAQMAIAFVLILGIAFTLITDLSIAESDTTVIVAPIVCEADEWDAYRVEAMTEYADEFTALFNSYEVKRAKNGAMMIRKGDTGSFKFARKI